MPLPLVIVLVSLWIIGTVIAFNYGRPQLRTASYYRARRHRRG